MKILISITKEIPGRGLRNPERNNKFPKNSWKNLEKIYIKSWARSFCVKSEMKTKIRFIESLEEKNFAEPNEEVTYFGETKF